MIAAAYTILRYGHGEIDLTGWGEFWLLAAAMYAAGSHTTNVVRDRAIRRADRAERTAPSGDTTAWDE